VLIRKESDQKRGIEEIKEWRTHLENLDILIKYRGRGRQRETEGSREGEEEQREGVNDMNLVTHL
jgi:hypothetical protein